MSEYKNPLVGRPIIGIKNWETWRMRWDTAQTAEELIGLLHCGLRAIGKPLERAAFYLKVADGHRGSPDYFLSDTNPEPNLERLWSALYTGPRTPSQLRLAVAKKAWQMLCKHFFTARPYPGSWEAIAHQEHLPELIDTLFWFFRPRGFGIICHDNVLSKSNGVGDPNDVVVREFALGFAQWAWQLVTEALAPTRNDRRQAIDALKGRESFGKPELMNLFVRLGETGWFLQGGCYRDQEMLGLLEREVFLKYESLASALHYCDEAACTYVILKTMLEHDAVA